MGYIPDYVNSRYEIGELLIPVVDLQISPGQERPECGAYIPGGVINESLPVWLTSG